MSELELIRAPTLAHILGSSINIAVLFGFSVLIWPRSVRTMRLTWLNIFGSILWTTYAALFILMPQTVVEQAEICTFYAITLPYFTTEVALFGNRIQVFYPMHKHIRRRLHELV